MIPPLSVLDLAPVTEGSTPGDALRNSLDLARNAERLGYLRYWVAEHHNMTGIMLPNHAPMVVAEQFGTLESLYPGRIDLGLGRAPGTDQLTATALRRDNRRADDFPQEVLELQEFLAPAAPGQRVRAVPGAGTEVPLWILGSSTFGAQLAAALGLPYAFASHFAPDAMMDALRLYHEGFRPSAQLERPYAMVGVNVVVAAIILWNTRYLEQAVGALSIPEDVARHIAPLGWEHISLTGDYSWNVEDRPDPDALRPLRAVSSLLAA